MEQVRNGAVGIEGLISFASPFSLLVVKPIGNKPERGIGRLSKCPATPPEHRFLRPEILPVDQGTAS